jgi:hypothetical protein
VRFPAGVANLVRGGLGKYLHETAPADVYEWFFAPRRTEGPSGFQDSPRPFVLRANHLASKYFAAGEGYHIDIHVFDVERPVLPYVRASFEGWAAAQHSVLLGVEQYPGGINLDAATVSCSKITVQFRSRTELKAEGKIVEQPEFFVLFGRARDRISSLCSLYGDSLPELDFAGMGERARQIRMTRCEVEWQRETRTSRRSGQTHPLGGFIGEAEYEGSLKEFLPWLEAAQWTGVGRQTTWGKGEILVSNITPRVVQ